MNLKKVLTTGLASAGVITWLALVPLVVATKNPTPTMARVAAVQSQAVNVNTDQGSGSGVVFHKHNLTYVLTAGHVVDHLAYHDAVEVTQGQYSWSAVIVNVDAERDLALLRLDTNPTILQSAHLAKRKATFSVGTRLLHVGNLLGEYSGSYVEGVLSAHRGEFSQSTVLAWPGSSGGGIWTTDGQLIGVLTRGAGPGLNFFIPHNHIWRWAVENDLQWLFL